MDEKTKALVGWLAKWERDARLKHLEFFAGHMQQAQATIRAQAEEIERLRSTVPLTPDELVEELAHCQRNLRAAEAKLAALLSAEGCDVEGALDAWNNEPCEVHTDADLRFMSAALATGCAPLRAKIERLEREKAEWLDNYKHAAANLKMASDELEELQGKLAALEAVVKAVGCFSYPKDLKHWWTHRFVQDPYTIDIIVRKDGVERRLEGDLLAPTARALSALGPAREANDGE